MEFDMDKVGTIELDAAFFKEHSTEITSVCIRLEPNTDGMINDVSLETRIKALNEIAEKYKYGPFANLCDMDCKNMHDCTADPEEDTMHGWDYEGDNVCFCKKYEEGEINERECTIETETPSPG